MVDRPDSWTLTLLKATWIPLGVLLTVVTIVIAFWFPDRMVLWVPPLGILITFTAGMGTLAWSGPQIRRAQEIAAAAGEK